MLIGGLVSLAIGGSGVLLGRKRA